MRDSTSFTPEGRRLLASMGAIEEDPLLVAAEEWLAGHAGPMTEAVREVRRLISPWSAEYLEAAERMKNTTWKGPLR